ncbi:MAG: hypothetical protein NZ853_10920 [Leptospiraceae bacterium]|nr:hypothetical protein [Leptospiraceae bacterium]MDW7977034.1 hypothetical protein [Leptospiraceae bacterium]
MKLCRVHTIWLSLPVFWVLVFLIFGNETTTLGVYRFLVLNFVYVIATIPFFYWFFIRHYRKNDPKSLIPIQVEIFVHFLFAFLFMIYSQILNTYLPIYYFLIFLIVYFLFKLAILLCSKKTYLNL